MLAPIRVLVVDDSALIRQLVTRAICLDPRIEIVGSAKTGVEAIQKARDLRPDVITLDIEMPELTGLEALPHIIKDTPARVIILSSLDDPETTYAALSSGAVDFVPKPKGGFATSLSDLADVMIKKIKLAYRVSPEKRLQRHEGPGARGGSTGTRPRAAGVRPSRIERLVVIGASTGGPPALEKVFSELSAELPVAYLIVQHLPAGFSASLAKRLTRSAGFDVKEARDGMRVEPGSGYVAPHGAHMIVRGAPGRPTSVLLDDAPAVHGVRPAADPLFASAAADYGARVTGVVMTGMGRDGARGLAAIVEAGGTSIVQDEASSVVWGMGGTAVRLGAAQNVSPLGGIAAEIRRTVRERG